MWARESKWARVRQILPWVEIIFLSCVGKFEFSPTQFFHNLAIFWSYISVFSWTLHFRDVIGKTVFRRKLASLTHKLFRELASTLTALSHYYHYTMLVIIFYSHSCPWAGPTAPHLALDERGASGSRGRLLLLLSWRSYLEAGCLAGDGEPMALLGLQAMAAACEFATICWSRFACSCSISCSRICSALY